ncbi:hypothetical protein PR048_023661 [Dryococelus australis]|uniref:DDE Tnp4 domain-containing protein n=1 Tax=Dryococelus australis TaxID=614101 RepID=A0ABQ9GUQ2_9NEOP|nr:hypothetical protein PR048_023661 [Dryococelus australis]
METQLSELMYEPSGEFKKFIRMSLEYFEYLLDKISPSISKKKNTLKCGNRFLPEHGLQSLYDSWHQETATRASISYSNVQHSTSERTKALKRTFLDVWDLLTEIMFYNVLLIPDLIRNFAFADIRSRGRNSDGGVFRDSLLWQGMCSDSLNLPVPRRLSGSNRNMPYVFSGDGAFAMSTHMKPFPGNHGSGTPKRIFNQRVSKCHVVVENTFGVLSTKFRVFGKPFALKKVILPARCILDWVHLTCTTTINCFYNLMNGVKSSKKMASFEIYLKYRVDQL